MSFRNFFRKVPAVLGVWLIRRNVRAYVNLQVDTPIGPSQPFCIPTSDSLLVWRLPNSLWGRPKGVSRKRFSLVCADLLQIPLLSRLAFWISLFSPLRGLPFLYIFPLSSKDFRDLAAIEILVLWRSFLDL